MKRFIRLCILIVFLFLSCVTFPRQLTRSFDGEVYYFIKNEPTSELVQLINQYDTTEEYFAYYLDPPYYAMEKLNNKIIIYKITDENNRAGVYFILALP